MILTIFASETPMTPKKNATKYIIALLPAKEPENYVRVAQDHFSKIAQGCILSKTSLPHITISQYFGDKETLPPIIEGLKKLRGDPKVQFTGLSFIKYQNQPHFWWAELSVARNPDLIQLHHSVVQLLQDHKMNPLNESGELYRPHLTLARVNQASCYDFPSDILKEGQFELTLGETDGLGQFVKGLQKF